MKANKIIIIMLFAVIGITQLAAKDQTHEKPDEYPEPDTHRVFIRGLIGSGNYLIPEVEENKREASAATGLSVIGGLPSLYSSGTQRHPIASQANIGLEYRYKDRVRLMHDQRSTNVSPLNNNYSATSLSGVNFTIAQYGTYDWQEDVTKTGVAYYHPITKRFNIGAILRNYTIEQSYGLGLTGPATLSAGGLRASATAITAIGSYARMSGLVPGAGFEVKIFRWLDFIYTVEGVNLKGTKTSLDINLLVAGASAFVGLGGTSSTFNFTGNIQNAAFVFKYSTWFSTKFGMGYEKYNRQFNSYYAFSGGDSAAVLVLGSLLYSNLVSSTSTLHYAYLQFEFSKGF